MGQRPIRRVRCMPMTPWDRPAPSLRERLLPCERVRQLRIAQSALAMTRLIVILSVGARQWHGSASSLWSPTVRP